MEIKSALANGLSGIQKGLRDMEKTAAKVASAEQLEGKTSPAESLVELRLNRLQVEANAKVVQTVDQTLGSLLDEKV